MITRRDVIRSSLAMTGVGIAGWGCTRSGKQALPGRLLGPSAALGHRLWNGGFPTPSASRDVQVVIAGGGIAGLAAAYALKRCGIRDVLIVDMLDEAGGNSSCGRNAVSAYPWGAHYVPLVRADCTPVLELFTELGIITGMDEKQRPIYNEYFISADPQERLWMYGRWQEGFVPTIGASARDLAQFNAFFAATERMKHGVGSDGKPLFAIPVANSTADDEWRGLDRISFAQYLRAQGFDSPRLLWYADYCCRDDYGALAADVSAWAGLHYFASRNGVAANADASSVVTWPEGNGHLVRELARLSAATFQGSALVTRVARVNDGVTLDYFDPRLDTVTRVKAKAAVVCLPRFVAARVVEGLGPQSSAGFTYSPWMVANLTLSRLPEGRGEPLAWDNAIYDSPLLGYVVATHQGLERQRQDTVITYYWPMSTAAPEVERRAALARPIAEWQRIVLDDLLRVHPELERSVENMDVWVWGHGMIRPTPGFIWGGAREAAANPLPPRVLCAFGFERHLHLRRGLLPRPRRRRSGGCRRGRAGEGSDRMSAASHQPWVHSAAIDGSFILAPGFLVSIVSLLLIAGGHGGADLSPWLWGVLIVGIDVAHVYSTLYRTYLDPLDRPRLASWLMLTPLVGWVLGVMVYSSSSATFWTLLAYLAVFHFVRQQYGFLMIYSRGERALPTICGWIDRSAVYGATLGPLVYWHAHLPRRFVWFMDGDFLPLPARVWSVVAPVYAAVMVTYVLKEIWLVALHRRLNVPRNAIVIGTAMSWYIGIVAAGGDLIFTMTNVAAHGIPYMALTFIFAAGRQRRERGSPHVPFARSLLLAICALVLLAFLEEGLWDGLVWREHLDLFPGFARLPRLATDTWLALVVPLLAVPQLTHYVIDGVIWRLKSHPDWRRTLFWRAESVARGW